MVLRILLAVSVPFALLALSSEAAEFAATEQLYFDGKYHECLEIAEAEVQRNVWNDRWPQLVLRCQLTLGRYAEAKATYEKAIRQFGFGSLALRLLGRDVYVRNNDPLAAQQQLDQINAMLSNSGLRFSSNENLVAVGRYYVEQGEDAKKILELVYDRIRTNDPNFAEVYVATAELALSKNDFKLAAETLVKAVKLRPNDPYIEYLAAKAWLPSDRDEAQQHLSRALELNPAHVPSLLLVADRLIDAEEFSAAKEVLTQVFQVNLSQPEAWAYHAVIAHLQGFSQAEKIFREIALSRFPTNPQVDHLIGEKLSRHYRFREGAEYQQRALAIAPEFLAAKFQLAQDLLHLGKEAEGWKLAKEVKATDGYNVVAHNLVTLQSVVDEFVTLADQGLLVRMDAREARIYGPAVMQLLVEAKETLATKYDVTIDAPILVEIFPTQKDFAIRTFGLPGGAGFLGVCFGRVITANSPASQGNSPTNWQSVLWHEFCHVVTLEKTNNKMPRWLSEGISVYEERQRDASWGQGMNPQYRMMILGDDLTPVSSLSSAFLDPQSPLHLQFAYYESSLVVQFLIERHGFDGLLRLLTDLGVGMPINEALTRYTGSLEELDQQFADYAKDLAKQYGDKADWDRESLPEQASLEEWRVFNEEHPNNVWALRALAREHLAQKDYPKAKEALERLRVLLPEDAETGGTLQTLAEVYQHLGDTTGEVEVLNAIAQRSSDAVPTYLRLAELAEAEQRWDDLQVNARRLLAVNPLSVAAQQLAAKAAEKQQQPTDSAAALQALLEMEPLDPAELRYRLAVSLEALGKVNEAKRSVLMALEDAPRYREALELLLRLTAETIPPAPPKSEE